MNSVRKPFTEDEAKIQASLLLKSLKSDDPSKAIKRFSRLPEFSDLSTQELLQKPIKLKHALAVVAFEKGFRSWLDLKMQLNFIIGGHLNLWFSNYEEAVSYLKSNGGFLLPYKTQYFICDASYLKRIGFDPKDSDWQKIGFNVAVPADTKAWERLYSKWKKATEGHHE